MPDKQHAIEDNANRIEKLITGRWGDSPSIAQQATDWYTSLGITSAEASVARLHPIVEYVANCNYTGGPCSVDAELYIKQQPSVESSPFNSESWKFGDSGADADLLNVITPRVENRGWTLRPTDLPLQAKLQRAVERLQSVSGSFTASALSFTRRHAFVASDRLVGRTWVDIGGLIISGDQAVVSTDVLAESVFHESLHAKFYAIERGLRLPTPDMGDAEEIVRVPWQQTLEGQTQYWTAHRALDAFYVYVHLGALRMSHLHSEGRPEDIDRLRRIAFRSAFLSCQIETVCRTELDDQRLEIWNWLDECRVEPFDLSSEGEKLLRTARQVA